jgi:hypothetical protein
VCDGYQKSAPSTSRIIFPKLEPDFQPIFYQPSTTWIQSHDEDRFFRFFTDSMVPQLAGYFESELWNRLILQSCQQDVAVRHAIIEMAASKSAADAAQSRDKGCGVQIQHQYAIRQYSKAIRFMRDAAVHEKQVLRGTLMTSLVILCFEMLHGDHEAAVKQVLIGLDLIDAENIKNGKLNEHAAAGILNVEDELVQAFGRLDIQTMSLVDPGPPSRHSVLKNYGSNTVASMPEKSSSLEEARMYSEVVIQRLMHLMASITPEAHSLGCLKLDVLLCVPDWYIEERDKYLEEQEQWYAAFTPILAGTEESDKNYLGAKALELQYLTSFFAAAVIRLPMSLGQIPDPSCPCSWK